MRTTALLAALLIAPCLLAQTHLPAVLKVPGMDAVEVQKDIRYDGNLSFDLYRPAKSNALLPVVIFVNGIGNPGLKEWGQYTSWPRLVATRGMAAVTYQTGGDPSKQTERLLAHLAKNAGKLRVDNNRLLIWACSANVSLGTAMVAARDLRGAVLYYGTMQWQPMNQNVPVFIARAGLDIPAINDSIDKWVKDAMVAEAPVTLVNYPQGAHGFDIRNDTPESKEIIRQTLDFLQYHANNPRAPRKEPLSPARLWRMFDESGMNYAVAQLEKIRKTDPSAYVLNEPPLNALGYALLGQKRVSDAIRLFEFIVTVYEKSPNAHDSLADAYEIAGRKDAAIREATRALELLDQAGNEQSQSIRKSAEEKLKRLQK